MLLYACLLAIGTLSGYLVSPIRNIFVIVFVAAAVLAAFFIFLRINRSSYILIFSVISFVVGAMLSSIFISMSTDAVPLTADRKQNLCEGVVKESPIKRDWGATVDVRLSSCMRENKVVDSKGVARLSVDGADADLLPGERIRFVTVFSKAREFKNPGSFSYRDYLLTHGISMQGRVLGRVERTGGDRTVLSFVEILRRRISLSLTEYIEPDSRGVVEALATGNQHAIAQDIREIFASTGLAHILAISGMNVAYIAFFIYFLSRFLFGFFPNIIVRVPLKRLAAIVTIPSIWIYVGITGSSISAVRAAIMLSVYLVGVIIGRRQDLLTTLAVAIVIIMVFLPLSIVDVSFQLSVMAVLGIAIITPIIVRLLGGEVKSSDLGSKIIKYVKLLFAATIAATIATSPLVAYHFKFISLIGIFANLIAVPVTGAFLSPVVAVASAIALLVPKFAAPFWFLSARSAEYFILFSKEAASLGEHFLFRWAPNIWELFLLYAVVGMILYWKKIGYRKIAVALMLVVIAVDFGYWHVLPKFSEKLEITVLDVGQGDSTFIRFPGGKTMLIDGGGIRGSNLDVGKNVVAPFLWRKGIYNIDYVLLTHPHYDHYKGLIFMLQEFEPGLVWTNGIDAPLDETGDWLEFQNALKNLRVSIVNTDIAKYEIGGAVLNMRTLSSAGQKNLNDTSIVTSLSYKGRRFLFTGDTSAAGEKMLLGEPAVDFLKVGHHGSKDASSEDFLKAIRPRVAVISAGEKNNYGFPHRDVLARLTRSGSEILRTDLNGAVTVLVDGGDVTTSLYRSPRKEISIRGEPLSLLRGFFEPSRLQE